MRLVVILEIGDRVEFIQDYVAKTSPDLFPPVGSQGEVYKTAGHGVYVQWEGKRLAKYIDHYIPRDFVKCIKPVEKEGAPWE